MGWLDELQDGGSLKSIKKAYNPSLAKDKGFQDWYRQNTLEGQNNVPYSDKLNYDYLSFYMNKEHKNKEFNIEKHFPDTYKRPTHETFSDESIYSVPENPGGHWDGEMYIPHGVKQFQQGGQFDGLTNEGFNYNGAWGGPAQSGASMPGSVGFTYARTKGIPSNGKYAKKTLPSAQKGAKIKKLTPEQIAQMSRDFGKNNRYNPGKKEQMSENLRTYTETKEYQDAVRNAKLAEERQILRERKEKIAKSVSNPLNKGLGIVNPANWSRENLAEATGAIGDKFRLFPEDPDSFIDDYLNPGVMIGNMASDLGSAPLRAKQENSNMPYVTAIGTPLVTGALEGLGTRGSNVKFANNLVNPFNVVPGYSYLEDKAARSIAMPAMRKLVKEAPAIKEYMYGINTGLKQDPRPFFEKFPITKGQKEKVIMAQNKAWEEGNEFVNDWYYNDQGIIRPEAIERLRSIDPSVGSFPKHNLYSDVTTGETANPLTGAKKHLISSGRKEIANSNISDEAKEFLAEKRGTFFGVNVPDFNESITMRNFGPYYQPPSKVKETAAHELTHSTQRFGANQRYYNPNTGETIGGAYTNKIVWQDPSFTEYYFANPNTAIGREFGEAMVDPVPNAYTWEASPKELHSELMVARNKIYDKYIEQGMDKKDVIQFLQDPPDAVLDYQIKAQNLNRFFKPDISEETKRALLRKLPAVVPIAGAASALQQQKHGGIIEDDLGQWAHPGEITRINSNNITMKNVDYPVIGVSDTGDKKLMKPGKNYKFKGSVVTEYPVMAKDGSQLIKLDQLTNFTNYNTPQPGGWLDNL